MGEAFEPFLRVHGYFLAEDGALFIYRFDFLFDHRQEILLVGIEEHPSI